MPRICLVVADAARARILTCEPGDAAADLSPRLVDHVDLVNPERRLRPSQVHSETRPGTLHGPGGRASGSDDHRDQHREDVDQRFAGEIYRQLGDVLTAYPATKAVIVASPHMLGLLRRWIGGLAARRVEVQEVARDLTLETVPQLHDHLADLGLVPARTRRSAT
ncbi:MAG: host attachment protein [Kofleriaceae bacterium]|nr:host attachment protein [Kofleriaceae bacterium]MCL4225517.1 host attachment protein [Myxococcales bacterium]